ncbi:MAG: hypothetical protein EP332_09020 [Bacteroidetes bacterium]|nr:MAG: hypothetical protein EP332_09020 [Bacteroidota bacterium]
MKKVKSPFLLLAALALLSSCTGDEIPVDPIQENVLPCFITSDLVLTNRNPDGIDYYVECVAEVSAGTLRIEPGVEIAFKPGSGLRITNNGSIQAIGLDTMPIKFNGTGNAPSWLGISIESHSANQMTWCEIKHAGQGMQFNTQVAGYIYDAASALSIYGTLKMSYCTVSESGGNGISFTSESSSSLFKHNSFTHNDGYPVLCYAGMLYGLNLDSCSYSANKFQQIALFARSSNAEIEENISLLATSIPYASISDLFFTGNTSFEAGVTLEIGKEMALGVNESGKLVMNGTASQHVIVKGQSATAGFWKGLLVNTSSENEFNYLDISDGGNTAYYASEKTNIAIGSANPAKLTLNNCTSANYEGNCAVAYSLADGTLVNNSPAITNVCTY